MTAFCWKGWAFMHISRVLGMGSNVYMDAYMADFGKWFSVRPKIVVQKFCWD